MIKVYPRSRNAFNTRISIFAATVYTSAVCLTLFAEDNVDDVDDVEPDVVEPDVEELDAVVLVAAEFVFAALDVEDPDEDDAEVVVLLLADDVAAACTTIVVVFTVV